MSDINMTKMQLKRKKTRARRESKISLATTELATRRTPFRDNGQRAA